MFAKCISILSIFLGLSLLAQTTDYGVSVGYQEVDIDGNEQVYRSHDDVDSGLLLQDLYLNISDPEDKISLFDHLRLDANGFGGAPYGRLKLAMKDAERYDLELNYRRYSQYNLLPAYANPFIDQGLTPGQHARDYSREYLELEVTLRPGRAIQPIVGVRLDERDGPAQTTFSVGGDEFRLDTFNDESQQELYGGLAFHTKQWEGELVHGVRDYEGREAYSLMAGGEEGNSTRVIFGHPINLENLEGTERVDVDTPITRFHVSGRPNDKLSVLGSFVHADTETEVNAGESLLGNLLSFRLGGLFGARQQTVQGTTESPSWRGDLRLIYRPAARVNLDVSATRRHQEMEGLALLSTLFLDVTTFGGNPVDDYAQLIDANTYWEREDTTYDARATIHLKSNVGLWTSFGATDRDTVIEASEAQIVVPIGQDGAFQRTEETFALGGFWRQEKVRINVQWQRQDADEMIFRTDFLERDRFSAKVKIKAHKYLNFTGSYRCSDFSNDTEQVDLEGTSEILDLGGHVQAKNLQFQLSYGAYKQDSSVFIRIPQTLDYELSEHLEDGHSYHAQFNWELAKKHRLGFSYNQSENEGALPFELEQSRIMARFQVVDDLQISLEGVRRKYEEIPLPIADYDADTYGLFFHWSK